MKLTRLSRKHITSTVSGAVVLGCIAGYVAIAGLQRDPNSKMVSVIQQHGGQIEYHRGIGTLATRVKTISLPAAALDKIDPVAFHVFPYLRVLHLTHIPTGSAGKTYETACFVNGKEELTKLVAEYRKAGLMR